MASVAAQVREKVMDVLKGTSVGRQIMSEAEASNAAREARLAARAKLDAAEADRAKLPKLAEAVDAARATYEAEMNRLAKALADAGREYRAVATTADAHAGRAESHLRRTAHPMVHESGPICQALRAAIQHLRRHLILVADEERVRDTAKAEPRSRAREHVSPIEDARAAVKNHDTALELREAFDFALAELRDLQLEVDPSPAAVREIIEGLPVRCVPGCHHEFTITTALAKALAPQEVKK